MNKLLEFTSYYFDNNEPNYMCTVRLLRCTYCARKNNPFLFLYHIRQKVLCGNLLCARNDTNTHQENTNINLSTQEFYLKQIKTIKSHFK